MLFRFPVYIIYSCSKVRKHGYCVYILCLNKLILLSRPVSYVFSLKYEKWYEKCKLVDYIFVTVFLWMHFNFLTVFLCHVLFNFKVYNASRSDSNLENKVDSPIFWDVSANVINVKCKGENHLL
jgi:hypothetical protein